MTTLLVGFDSAWTAHDSGALVGLLHTGDGGVHELCPPRVVDYRMAETVIPKWKAELFPTSTLILLDQLTIVPNPTGQRRVENIVGSVVSLRRGGMQPANTSKKEMFGEDAPIWEFPIRFGGPTHPLEPVGSSLVIETYPVLTMIALGWMLPDMRATGRLPKYNPERRAPSQSSTGGTSAEEPHTNSESAASTASPCGETVLAGYQDHRRLTKTAWTPVCACWWRSTSRSAQGA